MVPVKLDAEKEGKETAKKYNVHGYPAILFVNGEGVVEGKIGGYMPPESFSSEMKAYVALHTDFPKMEAKYKAGDHSPQALSTLALGYSARGNFTKGEELIAAAEKAGSSKPSASLARAYNVVGDHYQESQQLDKAIGYFRKAIASTEPSVASYAHMSLAFCYGPQRKTDQAVNELKAILAMPNAYAGDKKMAQELIQGMQGKK